MRVSNKKKEHLNHAIKLMKQGKNNKEISQKIGITEKTCGKWLRPYRKNINTLQHTETFIIERLNKALKDKATPLGEIKKMLDSLKKLKSM